jgi:hypothetical protein
LKEEERFREERHCYLCDVCGHRWEVTLYPDYTHRKFSLENDVLSDEPDRCPECGNTYFSDL